MIDRLFALLQDFFCTDKNLIVIAIFFLTAYYVFKVGADSKEVIQMAISGYLGMALGQKMGNGGMK